MNFPNRRRRRKSLINWSLRQQKKSQKTICGRPSMDPCKRNDFSFFLLFINWEIIENEQKILLGKQFNSFFLFWWSEKLNRDPCGISKFLIASKNGFRLRFINFFNEKKNCHFRLQVLAWLTDDEFFQFSYFNFILQFGSCNDDLDDEENWFFMLIFVSVYIFCFTKQPYLSNFVIKVFSFRFLDVFIIMVFKKRNEIKISLFFH